MIKGTVLAERKCILQPIQITFLVHYDQNFSDFLFTYFQISGNTVSAVVYTTIINYTSLTIRSKQAATSSQITNIFLIFNPFHQVFR